MKITILCVGNLKEKYLKDAFREYAKRIEKYAHFEVIEIEEYKMIKGSPSSAEIDICIGKEGDKIASKIPRNSYVISLCIEGDMYSSEELSKLISRKMTEGEGSLCFIIGGSWGLSSKIKKTSDLRLSMSEMTFPHQLARIMLSEQIYRIFQIMNCGKYHK